MKKYSRDYINSISGWMKDRCREDWKPEYIGKLAIIKETRKTGIKAPIPNWEVESVDFEIVD